MAIGVFVVFALAYRDLLISGLTAFRMNPLSALILTPGKDTLLVGLVVALWIARAESGRGWTESKNQNPSAGALVALFVAAAILIWTRIVRSPDLLLASLAALMIGLASLRHRGEGARRMILPAIVLLLAVPIPAPLEGEWVWALQRATASSAAGLLDLLGVETTLEGIQIRWPGYSFDIGEGSSGFRLLQILIPVSLGIGHRSGFRGDRLASFAFAGGLVGFGLNVLHTVFLVLSSRGASDGTGFGGSTLQAFALLFASIGVVALLAKVSSRRGVGSGTATAARLASPTPAAIRRPVLLTAGLLCGLSILVQSPFEGRGDASFPLAFPTRAGGWSSTDLPRNYTFPYSSPRTAVLTRGYAPETKTPGQPNGIVELFVGYEARAVERIPSSKLPLPNSDWHLANEFESRRDRPDRVIRVTELSRSDESEFALVYSWRRRDSGILMESLRALSGIDAIVWTDERPRAAVRVATPLASQLRSDRRRAMQLLDRFVNELGADLDQL